MSYIHRPIEKRSQTEVLRKESYSVHKSANLIGVHLSTVARKLNHLSRESATIETLTIAFVKSANKGITLKLPVQFATHIGPKLQQRWSPDQLIPAKSTCI